MKITRLRMEWCVKKKRIQIRLSSLIYYTHVWTWSHSNEYMRIYETLKQSSILHMTSFPLNLTVLKIEQLKQHCHLWTENKTSAGVPSQIPAGGRDGPFSSALCNGVAMVEVVVGRVENCEVTASKLMMVKTWKTID